MSLYGSELPIALLINTPPSRLMRIDLESNTTRILYLNCRF